jgi:hypothetical protein
VCHRLTQQGQFLHQGRQQALKFSPSACVGRFNHFGVALGLNDQVDGAVSPTLATGFHRDALGGHIKSFDLA